MTDTIEPTEEQKQAARLHFYPADDHIDDATTLALACLLAEREHRLREELTAQCKPDVDMCGGCEACVELKRNQLDYALSHAAEERCAARADLDAARARIAELEGQASRDAVSWAALKGRERELEEREAAYLAQIKALTDALADLVLVSAPGMETLLDVSRDAARALLAARPGVDGWQLKAGAR